MGLGVGDFTSAADVPLDRRHSLIHQVVHESNRFDGLVNFDCSIDLL